VFASSLNWEHHKGIVWDLQLAHSERLYADNPVSYIEAVGNHLHSETEWSEFETEEEEEPREDSEFVLCAPKNFSTSIAPTVCFRYMSHLHGVAASELTSGLYILFHALLFYE
jgi:hypothetical protein